MIFAIHFLVPKRDHLRVHLTRHFDPSFPIAHGTSEARRLRASLGGVVQPGRIHGG